MYQDRWTEGLNYLPMCIMNVAVRPHKLFSVTYQWRRLFSFSCSRSAKFRYTRIKQSSQMGESDKRVRLLSFASVFLPPFIELKYEKRMIPMNLHELTTFEALGVITRFKAHARGRKIFSFWFTLGTKYSCSVKFKYTQIEQSSEWW